MVWRRDGELELLNIRKNLNRLTDPACRQARETYPSLKDL
jgi:hypothetical protein